MVDADGGASDGDLTKEGGSRAAARRCPYRLCERHLAGGAALARRIARSYLCQEAVALAEHRGWGTEPMLRSRESP